MGVGYQMYAGLVLSLLPHLICRVSHGSSSAPHLPLPPLFTLQAIDLIDEATARVKMEKTLKPEVSLSRLHRQRAGMEATSPPCFLLVLGH